mgnify:CR=1 FL=1
MKDIGRLLRDGDPVALEPEMSAADVQAVRRAVLAALATTASGDEPVARAAASPARRSQRRSPPACSRVSGPRRRACHPSTPRLTHASGAEGAHRQLQFASPGGTPHHLGLRSGVQSMKE